MGRVLDSDVGTRPAGRSLSTVRRLREIADILSRHGLGFLVGAAGLERQVPFHHGLLRHKARAEPYTQPEHLRLALEELGPTFVKLGQILSTRSDLLPPAYQSELAKLQDAAPPVAIEAIRAAVVDELAAQPEEIFAAFDPEPLAAASIGQAHAASLHDGTEIVVKVRRPGVVEQVERDLEIFRNLAARAARHWAPARDYDVVGLADEFASTLRAELDYLLEARNAERFAENFALDPDVHIPRVFWDTTTSRVLTLERVRGINVADVAALDAAGVDRRALAERATRITAQMIFEDGFFHADPHPGNLFVERSGRIGVIDFGMVGTVDTELRRQLGELLVALAGDDSDRLTSAVLALAPANGLVDRRGLRGDLRALVARYAGRAIADVPLARLVDDLLGIVRRHRLQLPREIGLLLKMLAMNEGLAARLDPGFRPATVLAPYARQLAAAQLSPAALVQRLGRSAWDVAQLGAELPEQLRELLDAAAAGRLEIHLREEELERLAARHERSSRRLATAVVAAAAMNALATLHAHRRRR